jgi:outer membrane murein-binding lipoprotein Lpp
MDKEFVLEITTGTALMTCAIDNSIIKHRIRKLERENTKMRRRNIITTSATATTSAGCIIMGIRNRMFGKNINEKINQISENNNNFDERLNAINADVEALKTNNIIAAKVTALEGSVNKINNYLDNTVHPAIKASTGSAVK